MKFISATFLISMHSQEFPFGFLCIPWQQYTQGMTMESSIKLSFLGQARTVTEATHQTPSVVCRYAVSRVVRPAVLPAWKIGQSNSTSLISSSNNGLSTSCRSAQSNLSSTLQSSHRYGLGSAAIH